MDIVSLIKSNNSAINAAELAVDTTIPCALKAIKLSYTEFTRRTEIISRDTDQHKVTELCDAFAKGDWWSPIYDDENFPHYALHALKEGKITTEDVATIQLYWSAIQAHGRDKVETLGLFSTEALNLIDQTRRATRGEGTLLNDEEAIRAFDKMRKTPRGQQVLFVVDGDPLKESEDRALISDQIITQTGINILCRVGEVRLIPSAALMQQVLKARFGDQAVELNWVIGLSSAQDIYNNGRNGTRDIALRFPETHLPDVADRLSAPHYDFTYHDFYHSWLVSSIPPKYRHLYLNIADAIQANKELDGDVKDAYWKSLVDMDVNQFRPAFNEKPEQALWKDLGLLPFKAGVLTPLALNHATHVKIAKLALPIIRSSLGEIKGDLQAVRKSSVYLAHYIKLANSRSPKGTPSSE